MAVDKKQVLDADFSAFDNTMQLMLDLQKMREENERKRLELTAPSAKSPEESSEEVVEQVTAPDPSPTPTPAPSTPAERVKEAGESIRADVSAPSLPETPANDAAASLSTTIQDEGKEAYHDRKRREAVARRGQLIEESTTREFLRAEMDEKRKRELSARLTKLNRAHDPSASVNELESLVAQANRERTKSLPNSNPARPVAGTTAERVRNIHRAKRHGVSPSELQQFDEAIGISAIPA